MHQKASAAAPCTSFLRGLTCALLPLIIETSCLAQGTAGLHDTLLLQPWGYAIPVEHMQAGEPHDVQALLERIQADAEAVVLIISTVASLLGLQPSQHAQARHGQVWLQLQLRWLHTAEGKLRRKQRPWEDRDARTLAAL